MKNVRWSALLILLGVLLLVWTRARSPYEGFDPSSPSRLLVINLARRPDRMASFVASAETLPQRTPVFRIEAVDGATLDLATPGLLFPVVQRELEDFKQRGQLRRDHYQLTPGSIGCALSHRAAWEHVVASEVPWIVCEDDALLPPTFLDDVQRARKLVASLPESHASNAPPAVILFHVLCNPADWDQLRCEPVGDAAPGLLRVYQFWSLAAVYLTPEACRVMLPRMLPMREQLDHAMSRWAQEGLIRIYAYPVVKVLENTASDIWTQMQP